MSTTFNISFRAVKPKDIPFLNRKNALYSIDFRAAGEGLDYDIPAMFKYENLIPWIVQSNKLNNTFVLTNEDIELSTINKHFHQNNIIEAAKNTGHSAYSIYKRISRIPSNAHELWVGIPHPDADKLAHKNKIKLNYTYESFCKRNNKHFQKIAFGDKTPGWKEITEMSELTLLKCAKTNSFLKRNFGSGGFTIFDLSESQEGNLELDRLINESEPTDWFIEDKIVGEPYSIQCYLETDNNLVVFGYTEQKVTNGKNYEGATILPISKLDSRFRNELAFILEKCSPVLAGYEGFFGLDFMVDNERNIYALELNVRVTSATIPVLLTNELGSTACATYIEDQSHTTISSADLILTRDVIDGLYDTLEFDFSSGSISIGSNLYLQLGECDNLPPIVNEDYVASIKEIVSERVSRVVDSSYHNFWPYGWTITLILADSHCVISSWYKEKNILIDAYSCKHYDEKQFVNEITHYFKGKVSLSESKERYLA